ncbi:MAG: FecR domain-containing protein [Bryobacterales bacterium]|nr:FecR domain-containing protein [Bryobacterales bacterium]
MNILRGAALVTVLLAGLTLAQAQVPDPGAARVVSLAGTLTLKGFRQESRLLRLNDSVQSGDELSTGENSHAVLQTNDGSTVTIYPDSHLIFNERSADVREMLHLFLGSIKVHVEKLSGRPNPQKLTTPTAVIAVRGTTFSVFVDDTDATWSQSTKGLSVSPACNPGPGSSPQGGSAQLGAARTTATTGTGVPRPV